AEFDIMYGEGISYESDVLNTALKVGAVSKSGASYSFGGEKLAVGFDASREKLKSDKKLLEEIKKKTLALFAERPTAPQAEES
ncbi:DNA recombination/repair protein RecA, partial [Patescibacteria group bacterium]|nr:DNA recombination/repair protein RecA [Patescibacteria group bacterium]